MKLMLITYYIVLKWWWINTWMTNVWSEIDFPLSANQASVAKITPRPVAASLPKEPPRSYRQKHKFKAKFTITNIHKNIGFDVSDDIFVYDTYNGLSGHNSRWVSVKLWILIQNPCHGLRKDKSAKRIYKTVQMLDASIIEKGHKHLLHCKNNTWALVPISGAGTSRWTPMRSWIFWVKTRVRRSNSLILRSLGLQPIPPLAPPYGMSVTAVFHVMSWARAFTSSGSTWHREFDNLIFQSSIMKYQIVNIDNRK